ncbi:MAG: HDOD domain-containing protein [Candidatus Latescibacteria bacterium]|jgi:HD-like signal output (HDOD) protein|nr:HDOD domain-containing protein [Candidatus Latescibacterota bacterium]
MTETQFQEFLDQTEDLPQLPEAASAMVRLTRELSVPVQQVAELLGADPALQERMLIVINSPFYRLSGSIDNIEDALSLVGYRKLCDLAASLSLLEVFPIEKAGGIDNTKHWELAVCQAVAAAEVAARFRKDIRQDAFSLGLIQDAGSLLLSRYFPMEYGQAIGLAVLHREGSPPRPRGTRGSRNRPRLGRVCPLQALGTATRGGADR